MAKLNIPHAANFAYVSAWRRNVARVHGRHYRTAVRRFSDDTFHLAILCDGWKETQASAKLTPGSKPSGSARLRWAPGASLELVAGPRGARLLESVRGQCFGVSGSAWVLRFRMHGDEHYFGLGEKWGPLEKSGTKTVFYNTDVWGAFDRAQVRRGDCDPLYGSIPYLIIERRGYFVGILVDSACPVFMQIPGSKAGTSSARSGPGWLDVGAFDGAPSVYVLAGASLAELTERLQRLVGTTPRPPLWALGHHQCRWGYRGAADLRALDRAFNRHRIPCDGLWLDIDYMRGYRVFTLDPAHLPRPAECFSALKRRGRRVVAILDPGVKREAGFSVHDEGISGGHFCVTPEGRPFVGLVWPGETVFPDFAKATARAWWAGHVARFAAYGFSGFWLDMNEPATGGVDTSAMLFDGGRQSHASYHNHYALGMAQASHAGMLEFAPDSRPLLVTRACAASISRFAAVWTGDNYSNELHLKQSIPTTLNLALSGVPFNGPDVPGFGDDADSDLLARWYKAGFLFPFLRNHSCAGTQRQEPWAFSARARRVARHFIALRYRLLPYLYSLFQRQERTGAAILRPLFYDFQDDPALFTVDDQFLVGPALMQAPLLSRKAKSRKVRLPRGAWYEAHTGRWREGGGSVTARDSVHGTPLYVREGQIVPMLARVGRHTESPMNELELHVFLRARGHGQASLEYESDDGASFAYRAGVTSRLYAQARVRGSELGVDFAVGPLGVGPFRVRLVLYAAFRQVTLRTPNGVVRHAPRPARFRFAGSPLRVWKIPRFSISEAS
ncbi:MAG TPA: TIM-barrel domain-containing protein [Polyangiaceae bacterium]